MDKQRQEFDFKGECLAYGYNSAFSLDMIKGKHILLLFGGRSTEHMVACRSAQFIAQALAKLPIKLSLVGITEAGEFLPYPFNGELDSASWEKIARNELAKRKIEPSLVTSPRAFLTALSQDASLIDLVFPVLHGVNCEDGAIQGLLRLANVPFVGSDILASACGMDKVTCKELLEVKGLPVVPWLAYERQRLQYDMEEVVKELEQAIKYPVFVKPSNAGSSVGASRVNNREELLLALAEASRFDRLVLVEKCKRVRELECAVLGNSPYYLTGPVGEIIVKTDNAVYDYQTKYFSNQASEACIPSPLAPELARQIQDYAIDICKYLQVSGLSRVDFFLDKDDNKLYVNEINTFPGFTSISLFPKVFAKAGIKAEELCVRLLCLALEDYANKQREEQIKA